MKNKSLFPALLFFMSTICWYIIFSIGGKSFDYHQWNNDGSIVWGAMNGITLIIFIAWLAHIFYSKK